VMFKIQNRCLVSRFRITGPHMVFLTGVVMGLSPCAPMIAALGLSIASKSAIMGGLIALTFGIGTVISPLLLIGLVTGKWASIREFAGVSNYVAGGFLILLGLLNLLQ
jgi:sulfite exporter TauE/SafE